jgi:hypothetical protein
MNIPEKLSEWAQKGAALGVDHGRMCAECAFRKGSVANEEPHNTEAAMHALAYEAVFHCHPPGSTGDAGVLCSGFQYAKAYLESKEKSVPPTSSNLP